MNPTRREFLQASVAATALAGIGGSASLTQARQVPRSQGKNLDLLILGGTRFLGPALVQSARRRGHKLTLFNRGLSNPNLFPDIERLTGDRDPDKDAGLSALKGRKWDAVIDTSGYFPRLAKSSAQLLSDAVEQYVFISTISVYALNGAKSINENSPVGTIEDETIENITNETYGPLKALCEKAVEETLPGRTTIIRPGLIVGPRDPTLRFTYWPMRISHGGEVLAPGDGKDPVQFIDARDLADFSIHCVEQGHTGVYNAAGPGCELTMAEMVHGCKAATSACVNFTWVSQAFLAEQNVSPWTNLPVWVPRDGDSASLSAVSISRSMEKGLKFRPLARTAGDTAEWFETLPKEARENLLSGPFGLKPEREAAILKTWHDLQTK